MIKDLELWNKVKDLTGNEKEVKRLDFIQKEGKITETEYWHIRVHWTANASKLRNK